MLSALSERRLASIYPVSENQMMAEMMEKGWTMASHSWSNTTIRLWAGLIGFTRMLTGTSLPFVQRNVCGPSLHLLLGLLHSASLATGSHRKFWTGPMIFSPSATWLKECSLPVVLVYYPKDIWQVLLHLSTWFLNQSTLTSWTTSINPGIAAWKQNTNRASVMLAYLANASSCPTQNELLCRPDILIEYQTFGTRDMLFGYNSDVLSQ